MSLTFRSDTISEGNFVATTEFPGDSIYCDTYRQNKSGGQVLSGDHITTTKVTTAQENGEGPEEVTAWVTGKTVIFVFVC